MGKLIIGNPREDGSRQLVYESMGAQGDMVRTVGTIEKGEKMEAVLAPLLLEHESNLTLHFQQRMKNYREYTGNPGEEAPDGS